MRLGTVSDILTGFPFKSAEFTNSSADPYLLRGDNIGQGVLRWEGAKHWPAQKSKATSPYWLAEDDIVVAMDRPWIDAGLKFAAVRQGDLPALLVQRVARLRGTRTLDVRFLRYVVAGKAFTDYILGVQTGTAVPHISRSQIEAFEFNLPTLDEQRAIASILGALDDKIELNRKMSATLEAIARALFKSWFVDFDPVRAKAEGRDPGLPADIAALFPDSWNVGSVSSVPAGWETNGLDDIAIFLNGLALQKFPPKDGAATLPVIKIAQLRAGHSSGADRASTNVPRDYVIGNGDILFSWSGSLECHIWTGGPGALNQHLFKVSGTRVPSWFAYLAVHEHLSEFRHIAASKATTMGHIQRHHLHEAKITVPPLGLIEAASSFIGPMIEASWTRRLQCSTLAALRDALLPKLISGELRVGEAERVLAASA